ncbi:AbrB/MazE/SpoVT family DNA-binding domain-containing protein [Staphylococcus warneri]|uniref:AbrB/MazE/SpoVT family DNA-binding domain-containing protein n=1 Tax=Staphylococcus warneri TaxID=1292 RepID=UPI000DF9664B|nr:AbrB/MazE/SpoVT family DNA-binding domain-containing protein [Staphylococcus warneri]SUM97298.1 phage protein [Staphylococcus warneri]
MTVIHTRKLRKSGNSNILTIPKEVIKALDVVEGQFIAFNVVNGRELYSKRLKQQMITQEIF